MALLSMPTDLRGQALPSLRIGDRSIVIPKGLKPDELETIMRIVNRSDSEERFDDRISIATVDGLNENDAVRMAYFELRNANKPITELIKSKYRKAVGLE
jgi:hypothetical protein